MTSSAIPFESPNPVSDPRRADLGRVPGPTPTSHGDPASRNAVVRSPILLDRNENRYGAAPGCLAVLRAANAELLFNYTRDFQKGYYSVLSKRLAEMHGVDEKRVVLGYGCEDLLKQTVHHFVRPGERCLIPSASWWYYRAIAAEVDGVTLEYPMVETPERYEYDLDGLFRLQERSRARLLLLSTPNNPTGNAFPLARLPEVLERFCDATVVVDQAYFGFSAEPELDVARLTLDHPNLLLLRSFSKLFGLAGARIGYAVTSAGHAAFRQYSGRNLGFSRVIEALALAALDDRAYYELLRGRIGSDRARILAALRAYPGVRAYDSETNFVLARFPAAVIAPLQAGLLAQGLVLKFFDEPAFASCARITIGTQAETDALLATLSALLDQLVARPISSAPRAGS
jgi:histidinol-phosphate aminotransferase